MNLSIANSLRVFTLTLLLAVLSIPRIVTAANPTPSSNSTVIPYLTAAEEAKTFQLQPGYSLQLVVGDPDIREPVLAVFDGNGRMYVAEMRSYMQNIDGTNELIPVGVISAHWSSKGDGNFDRHTIFATNLVLPRMLLPLANGILVTETGSDTIWFYRDSKHDGVSDTKEIFLRGNPRGENLEHQPSGLIWDIDNWMYETVNQFRIRLRGDRIFREPTPANFGQWSLTQDDYGKTFFLNAMFDAGPVSFETPIVYGASEIDGKFTPGFPEVFPLVGTADYQGGPAFVRPTDKTLNHITGAAGADIFRGDRLPAELRGNLFFGEAVGRLIRRAEVNVKEGFTILSNPYESQRSEFIRSTDPNFRPVNLVTAPDGTLYIVDMYRGIIQESAWVGQGSYLRGVVQQLELEKNFGRGRIWRLVHKDFQPGPQPHLLDETPAQLVTHLDHPNGWWRDNAQKLLVLRGDKSVAPALVTMARMDTNPLARIHALWTLEGLDALEPALIREKLTDAVPQVRIAAIRTSETLYHAGDHSLITNILNLAHDSDPNVVIQVMLTAKYLGLPEASSLVLATLGANHALGVQKIGTELAKNFTPTNFPPEFSLEDRVLITRGEMVYKQLCFACHGLDGKGMPLTSGPPGSTMAPALAGNKIATGWRDGAINAVLKGVTGPVDGKTYTAIMAREEFNSDEWIASVLSYVRNSFGNHASLITTNDVAAVRAAFTNREAPWTMPDLLASLPQPLSAVSTFWKFGAMGSSSAVIEEPMETNYFPRFSIHADQQPGQWFEIRLRQPETIAGIMFEAEASDDDFPRAFSVQASDDGLNWNPPIAVGRGTGSKTEIAFPPVKTSFIRVALTGAAPSHYWSVHHLQLLGPAPPPPQSVITAQPEKSKYD